MNNQKKILVAPLDWGLGHATRCIPIINKLLHHNAEVIIAADNRPFDLLKKEFPNVECIRFPGHSIQYSKNSNLGIHIAKQLPHLVHSFVQEHYEIEKIIRRYKIDAIISDNRYGVFSKQVPSVFIIHQLHIMLPKFIAFAQKSVGRINKTIINFFDECWIPDFEGNENLAGMLSHPTTMPKKSYYIGPLSRLKKINENKKEFDVICICSGPEPQRTIFEEIVTKQLTNSSFRALVVQGIPKEVQEIQHNNNITIVSAMTSEELSKAIAKSKIVASRPGYSTIMDLSYVGANAIFIPTPQQTEQIYLAQSLKEKKICYSEQQPEFNLVRSINEATNYVGFSALRHNESILEQRINALLSQQNSATFSSILQ